jgi:hypothetical protein
LEQRIARIQHEQIQDILEEGYKARKAESFAITKEFEPVDLEGRETPTRRRKRR